MHFPPGLKPIAVDELRPGYIIPAAKPAAKPVAMISSISAQASGKSDNKE